MCLWLYSWKICCNVSCLLLNVICATCSATVPMGSLRAFGPTYWVWRLGQMRINSGREFKLTADNSLVLSSSHQPLATLTEFKLARILLTSCTLSSLFGCAWMIEDESSTNPQLMCTVIFVWLLLSDSQWEFKFCQFLSTTMIIISDPSMAWA